MVTPGTCRIAKSPIPPSEQNICSGGYNQSPARFCRVIGLVRNLLKGRSCGLSCVNRRARRARRAGQVNSRSFVASNAECNVTLELLGVTKRTRKTIYLSNTEIYIKSPIASLSLMSTWPPPIKQTPKPLPSITMVNPTGEHSFSLPFISIQLTSLQLPSVSEPSSSPPSPLSISSVPSRPPTSSPSPTQ